MKQLFVFDIEVLPNFFIAGFKRVGKDEEVFIFEISSRKNELDALVDFLIMSKDDYFVGYNCDSYDEPVLYKLVQKWHGEDRLWCSSYFQICHFIKSLSDEIIDNEKTSYRKDKLFKTIDLMTMLFSSNLRVGLKPLQVSMCYPNVEEMNIDWNLMLHPSKMDQLITYNHNDLHSTEFLFNLLMPDLQLRKSIKKQYKIECLSKDGVGTGVAIFTKYVCNALGLRYPSQLKEFVVKKEQYPVADILLPEIKFKSKAFNSVLDSFKKVVLDETGDLPFELKKKNRKKGDTANSGYFFSARHNDLEHTFGLGGLHSVNKPNIYVTDSEYVLIDADVASMYPSMCLQWGFGPSGFLKVFQQTMWLIYNQRLHAKHVSKDKTVDKTMKLVLNSILGNLRNIYSAYYAPDANAGICINGQLFLAMLIERLEEVDGIKCVMSNTDGITCLIHRSKLIEYYMLCDEWMQMSKLQLEFVNYEKMVIRSVNDYVAFVEGYSKTANDYDFPLPENVLEYNFSMLKADDNTYKMLDYQKQKGASFITYPRVGKGLNALIVPKAIINYFGKGIPVEKTIRDVKSIYDYVIYQKVGKQFKVMHGDDEVQHISRFFANPSKPVLRKVNEVGKVTSILSGVGIEIVNDLRDKTLDDFNINFKYYIKKANEIISEIEKQTNQTSLF